MVRNGNYKSRNELVIHITDSVKPLRNQDYIRICRTLHKEISKIADPSGKGIDEKFKDGLSKMSSVIDRLETLPRQHEELVQNLAEFYLSSYNLYRKLIQPTS